MKTIIVVAMMMLTVAQAQAALVGSSSSLNASLLYYEPVPAQPGDLLDVRILITNGGGGASRSGTILIVNSYPFTVESREEAVQEFPAIPAQESFLVSTKIRVDKSASEGTNELTVVVTERDRAQQTYELPLTVQGRSGALTIVQATTEPDIIRPGGMADLSIKIQNIGETRLRNVDLSLNLTGLSLSPVGSSNTKTISVLQGGEQHVFVFGLTAFPAAETNAYKIPVTIAYDDEQGNSLIQQKTIGVRVGAEPELLTYFDQVSVDEDSLEGEVIIRFVNKGLNEIKLLEMEVIESEDVEVTSESTLVYVGNIDEDDYETADLTLKVSGEVDVPLRIRYRDALNQPFEEEVTLRLKPRSTEGNGGPGAITWILLLLIAGGAIWWWRSRRKRGRR